MRTNVPQPTRDRIINVDGMNSDHCISKVLTALKGVKDLSVDAVKVSTVKLRAATRDETNAACTAIRTAGFECWLAPAPITTFSVLE